MALTSIREPIPYFSRDLSRPASWAGSYVFGSYALYPRQRRLVRQGIQVDIGGRAFDILLLLVSQAGRVVSMSEFMDFVWPNIRVEEANLRVQIGRVRRLLAQSEDTRAAIETVSLRGYCFVVPVQHLADGPAGGGGLAGQMGTLPSLLNPIFGRDETIDLLAKALDDRRLVTVTGPGGIGKSVAAIATAHRCAERFAGDITFVDLSQVADGVGAACAIAGAMQIETHDDPVQALCDALHGREMLLILDTCDHLVEPIAALAETLMDSCAQLSLMVTSREALRAAGEWAHRLQSLTFPEVGESLDEATLGRFSAVAMLVDRIRSAMRFTPAAHEIQVLAEICRRLDGIPLALELAAARVPELGLREIAVNLDDCFFILTRGRRTALPRHRTLSATLDWSYSLLSESEQRLLRILATLGRSFTAERAVAAGAAAGCGGPREALANLYEKSVVTVEIGENAPVYRLLDTTKAYVSGLTAV